MSPRILLLKIFLTGAITLALELTASRIMTPFFGVSIYVWSSILSITLIALAIGYKYGGVLAGRLSRAQLLTLFAASGGMAALWLNLCLWTYPFLFWPLADFHLVVGSIIACIYLLFVPLVILSALNPILVALLENKDSKGDHGAGSVFFISTVGSVAGVFAAAYGLLPFLTNYQTVVVLVMLSALLSLGMLSLMKQREGAFRKAYAVAVVAFVIALATLLSGGLERFTKDFTHNGEGWKTVDAAPSFFGNLKVVDLSDAEGTLKRRMLINDGMVQNAFDGHGAPISLYSYALERMALAAVAEPKKALVLGIGAGVVPMAYAADGMEVDAVDINGSIVDFAGEYFDFNSADALGKVNVIIADARTAARHCDKDYDIVAVDLFRDDGMPEHLVTQEFFSDIKACLKDGGVLVMNTFTSLTDPKPQNALIQTIASVFGDIYYIQRAIPRKENFTVGYLAARKGAPIKNLAVSTNNMPPLMAGELKLALTTACIFKFQDPLLGDAPVLTDVSNQWKHLAHANEIAYRRNLVANLPWQILVN